MSDEELDFSGLKDDDKWVSSSQFPPWNKMDWNDVSQLKDHYYYLVTHKYYKMPMKAKWHSENGGCWEVYGVPEHSGRQFSDFDYSWDDNHTVLAWMDMPDIYREEDKT